jgi:DNA (cytosine-5)-methyltransferase 1
MNELALFAGAGGGILGGHLLGWRTVCAVEWEPYPASVLCARQNDGFLPPFPIWDDIQTFDGRPWRGIVDVVSGGFPCQDISAAGKGAGIDGERSGMWREMARVIREVRPKFVFVENSPMLTSRGLGVVLGDLAQMGFDAKWGVLGAADVGAPHQRDRIWIVGKMAHTTMSYDATSSRADGCGERTQKQSRGGCGSACNVAHSKRERLEGFADCGESQVSRVRSDGALACATRIRLQGSNIRGCDGESRKERLQSKLARESCGNVRWWATEPELGRVADGVAARVDRLKAIGNGQVPEVARRAWEVLNDT